MTAPTVNRDEVRARLRDLLSETLDDGDVVLNDATTAHDVAGWDSLAHLKLLVAIEGAWRIKFAIAELAAPRDVGELVDLIVRKAGS